MDKETFINLLPHSRNLCEKETISVIKQIKGFIVRSNYLNIKYLLSTILFNNRYPLNVQQPNGHIKTLI